jgi:hypothetical protein
MKPKFDQFATALKCTIDFCQEPDVGLLSGSLLRPTATLYPLIYYLSRQKSGSVPDAERRRLRTVLYFLLFNQFLGRNVPSRVRSLRELLAGSGVATVPVDGLLNIVRDRQKGHHIQTTEEMLNWNVPLALNIVQPRVCRESLVWQAQAEVDHIFPQSRYRERYPDLVDDIGNKAYLGKIRNIRKHAEPPWEYFKDTPDNELDRDFLIDRRLLADERFEEFVRVRRGRIAAAVREFLGR